MLVNSIPVGANLRKLRNAHTELLRLFPNSKDKLMALSVMNYLEQYDIQLKYVREDTVWAINQVDFFNMRDLWGQMCLASDTYIHIDDIKPWRPLLSGTKRATLELNRLFLDVGITDTNCYIDNSDNCICFTKDGVTKLILLVDRLMIAAFGGQPTCEI